MKSQTMHFHPFSKPPIEFQKYKPSSPIVKTNSRINEVTSGVGSALTLIG